MPLDIEEQPLTHKSLERFEQVLRDTPAEWDRLHASIDDERARLFRAVFNGRAVGLLLLHETATGARLDSLVVHPATRGRGIGRALLDGASRTVNTEPELPSHCEPGASS